jgi:ribonuclease BN (tRNA processing enzyme)
MPLGAGNFFAAKRYCTSLVLFADGKIVLIDCPDPLFRMLAEASAKSGRDVHPNSFDHIVLTHLHGDHCNGLEAFGYWRRFLGVGRPRPAVYTSSAVAKDLWRKLSPSMEKAELPGKPVETYGFDDYFEMTSFEFGERFEVCGIKFETRRTQHSIPTFGFCASFGGRRFGYSCDTCYDPGHIAFLESCDLIFHETDHGIHTPLAPLEALPEKIRTKMRLIHLPDDFAGSSKIAEAEEGRVYPV